MRAPGYQAFNRRLAVAGEAEDLVLVDKGRMSEAWKVSLITDRDMYIEFDTDGTPDEENGLEVRANEGYSEEDILIARGIRFVNKNPGERPLVRGILWGG